MGDLKQVLGQVSDLDDNIEASHAFPQISGSTNLSKRLILFLYFENVILKIFHP
jgi:hypothetical protein